MKSNMYAGVKTWNPAVGCNFNCSYCKYSFQKVVKFVGNMHGCESCKTFTPHEHTERLNNVPSGSIIWPCAHGDIAFCSDDFLRKIIAKTLEYEKKPFYWQSKNPKTLQRVIDLLQSSTAIFISNHILLTTLETNRDTGYSEISKAPPPSVRARDFAALDWPRKIVTVEPILDFDLPIFAQTIIDIKPEMVWLGYNSKSKPKLPEPGMQKTKRLITLLESEGITVKTKHLPLGETK